MWQTWNESKRKRETISHTVFKLFLFVGFTFKLFIIDSKWQNWAGSLPYSMCFCCEFTLCVIVGHCLFITTPFMDGYIIVIIFMFFVHVYVYTSSVHAIAVMNWLNSVCLRVFTGTCGVKAHTYAQHVRQLIGADNPIFTTIAHNDENGRTHGILFIFIVERWLFRLYNAYVCVFVCANTLISCNETRHVSRSQCVKDKRWNFYLWTYQSEKPIQSDWMENLRLEGFYGQWFCVIDRI